MPQVKNTLLLSFLKVNLTKQHTKKFCNLIKNSIFIVPFKGNHGLYKAVFTEFCLNYLKLILQKLSNPILICDSYGIHEELITIMLKDFP